MSELDFATDWLQGWAKTYLPSSGSIKYSEVRFASGGISLVDLIFLFRRGRVVAVDMIDGPGPKGLWTVEGYDSDDRLMRATLAVEAEEMSIEVVDAERVVSTQRASNGAD